MAWFKTSNPALSDSVFRGEGIAYGDGMTISGTVNKTGHPGDLRSGDRSAHLEHVLEFALAGNRTASRAARFDRRIHRGNRHRLQKDVGADHRANLCAA